MTKYEEIQVYREAIKALQDAVDKLQKEDNATVKVGDYIICTRSVEWAYNKGDRMWVDTVNSSHILARSENPANRKNYVYWITNSDWVKE